MQQRKTHRCCEELLAYLEKHKIPSDQTKNWDPIANPTTIVQQNSISNITHFIDEGRNTTIALVHWKHTLISPTTANLALLRRKEYKKWNPHSNNLHPKIVEKKGIKADVCRFCIGDTTQKEVHTRGCTLSLTLVHCMILSSPRMKASWRM